MRGKFHLLLIGFVRPITTTIHRYFILPDLFVVRWPPRAKPLHQVKVMLPQQPLILNPDQSSATVKGSRGERAAAEAETAAGRSILLNLVLLPSASLPPRISLPV